MIAWKIHQSPLGPLRIAASEHGLCGLYFDAHRHFRGFDPDASREDPQHPLLALAADQLDEYFGGTRRQFTLPLDLRGTLFQQEVWQGLCRLPYGTSSSYAGQAALLGRPAAMRAVGAAIGRNPLCIIVPCHRVLRSDGGLAGYAGGLERKKWLLSLEARKLPRR